MSDKVVSRQYYSELASELEPERIQAAIKLIKSLEEVNDPEEYDYALNRLIKGLSSSRAAARIGFSTTLTEIINILSEDKSKLLEGNEPITVKRYITLLEKQINKSISGTKGKDERASLFGLLFGLKSLANSQLLIDNNTLNLTDLKFFIEKLINLSTRKSWIRESCFHTLFELLVKLIDVLSDDLLIDILYEINKNKLTLTNEGLSIYLLYSITNKSYIFSKIDDKKIPISNNWKNNNPLIKSNLTNLSKILKDTEVVNDNEEDSKKLQKGIWSPNLHFVWGILIKAVINNEIIEDNNIEENSNKRQKLDSKKSKKQQKTNNNDLIKIKDLTQIIVDDSLFSLKSSPERKYWGFKVFESLLTELILKIETKSFLIEKIDLLFTKNLMRTMINQSSNNERLLNSLVKKNLLGEFLSRKIFQLTKNSLIIWKILKNLWFSEFSNINFDSITNTKTTDSLLQNLMSIGEYEDFEELSNNLLNILNKPLDNLNIFEKNTKDEKSIKTLIIKKQKWVFREILLIIKYYKFRNNDKNSIMPRNEWLDKIIKTLIIYGFFKPVEESSVYIEEVSKQISKQIGSLLLDISSLSRIDNSSWIYLALKEAVEIENDKNFKPIIELDDYLQKLKLKTFKILTKINMKNHQLIQQNKFNTLKKSKSFELIYSIILLHFYNEIEAVEDSITILNDVGMAYKKFNLSEQLNVSDDEDLDMEENVEQDDEDNSDDDDLRSTVSSESMNDEFNSVDILLDIILGFMQEKNGLANKLPIIIWETFLNEINLKNLESLYEILEVKENVEGQNQLFNTGEDENEEDEEEEEFEEDDDEEENEEEEDDDKDEEEFLDVLDKKTTQELAKALKVPNEKEQEEEPESEDGELHDLDSESENSSDEESMDDEQMMAIDNQLSAIFKQRQQALQANHEKTGNARHEKKIQAQENMVLFKSRILNLLEIYIDKLIKNDEELNEKNLSLTMIEPLINLMNLTLNPNLRQKTSKLLIKLTKIKIDHTKLNSEEILKLIEKIQQSANNSNYNLNNVYNLLCLYLSKNLINLDKELINEIIDIYSISLKNWVNNKNSKLNHSLFNELINYFSTLKQQKSF